MNQIHPPMTNPAPSPITLALEAVEDGGPSAVGLLPLVYNELRRLAQ